MPAALRVMSKTRVRERAMLVSPFALNDAFQGLDDSPLSLVNRLDLGPHLGVCRAVGNRQIGVDCRNPRVCLVEQIPQVRFLVSLPSVVSGLGPIECGKS